MTKVVNVSLYALVAAISLGGGLWMGPGLRGAYERLFPDPPYISGDFKALYRETGKLVVLFSTSTCPHCRHAREFLDREHVEYQDFVVDQSADAERRFAALKGRPVPLLFIGDRRIVGFREDTIRESLALIRQAPKSGK